MMRRRYARFKADLITKYQYLDNQVMLITSSAQMNLTLVRLLTMIALRRSFILKILEKSLINL